MMKMGKYGGKSKNEQQRKIDEYRRVIGSVEDVREDVRVDVKCIRKQQGTIQSGQARKKMRSGWKYW